MPVSWQCEPLKLCMLLKLLIVSALLRVVACRVLPQRLPILMSKIQMLRCRNASSREVVLLGEVE